MTRTRIYIFRLATASATVLVIVLLALNFMWELAAAAAAEDIDPNAEPIFPSQISYDPKVLSAGDRITAKNLKDMLLASGLSEVAASAPMHPAAFSFRSLTMVEIAPAFPGIGESIAIEIGGDRVDRLILDGNEVGRIQLPPRPMSSLIYDLESQSELVKRSAAYRIPLRNLEAEESIAKKVLCASEGGCDTPVVARGIVRAAYANLKTFVGSSDDSVQGGSGVCSQWVKNVQGDKSRRISRKLSEVYTCSDLSRRMSPARIFQAWANVIPFGTAPSGRHLIGLETASRELFDKKAKDLNLGDSVTLASLVSEPRLLARLSAKSLDEVALRKVQKKRQAILDNMMRKGIGPFTMAEFEKARKSPLTFTSGSRQVTTQPDRTIMPIVDLAGDEFPAFRRQQNLDEMAVDFSELAGLIGISSVDDRLQKTLETIQRKRLLEIQKRFPPIDEKGKKPKKDSLIGVTFLMDNSTGLVLALAVTSTNPKIPLGTLYVRHGVDPASRFKPPVYGCALDSQKITLATRINPADGHIKRLDGSIWRPAQGVGNSPMTIAEAFASSDDGVAIVVANMLGLDAAVKCYATATGATASPLVSQSGSYEYPPITFLGFGRGLGTNVFQFASAYSAFARGGAAVQPRILKNVFVGGQEISLRPAESRNIYDPQSAYLVFTAMRGSVGSGPLSFRGNGTAAGLPFARDYLKKHPEIELGVKTGSGNRSVGIVAITPRFTYVTNIFYKENSLFRQIGNENIYAAWSAGLIWSDFMTEVVKLRPELFSGRVPRPESIIDVPIDIARNCRVDGGIILPFITGTEPPPCDTP